MKKIIKLNWDNYLNSPRGHDKNGIFNKNKCTETYRWEQMEDAEKFNELKRMLTV